MVKAATLVTQIGGRGGTADALDLSGYQARTIVASLTKIDAGTTGQVWAENMTLKPYAAAERFAHTDSPSNGYEFPVGDIGSTSTHETVSNAVVGLSAANALIGNSAGAARYANAFGILVPTQKATDVNSGHSPLRLAENNAQPWTWEAWIYRAANGANTEVMIESDGGLASFISISLLTTGQLQVSRTNGGGSWTSPAGAPLPLAAWSHNVLVYSAAGATHQLFTNGASAGAATASTRGSGYNTSSPQTVLNRLQNTQAYVTQLYEYQNVAFVADDASRHYNEIATDLVTGNFLSGTANLGINNGASVIFSNQIAPGFDASSYSLRMPLTPYVRILTSGGVFLAEVTTYREDE